MTIKDIKISWDNYYQHGDINVVEGDLETDDGLTTAILISLFSDARAADDDELPDPLNSNKRGWWGGQYLSDDEEDTPFCKLWLLERSKTTQEVLTKAKNYVEDALQWLIDDEIASSVDVEIERQGPVESQILAIKVGITVSDTRYIELLFGYNPEELDGGIDYLYVNGEKISFGTEDYLHF